MARSTKSSFLPREQPREIALADPAALEHDLAEPAIGLLRLDKGVANSRGTCDAVTDDQTSER